MAHSPRVARGAPPSRKNVGDFRGRVINPRGHFVLPDKGRLSRNDASELLSNQQFGADNPRMRSIIPQLLQYIVSPYNSAPTVAGEKVRGGGWGIRKSPSPCCSIFLFGCIRHASV